MSEVGANLGEILVNVKKVSMITCLNGAVIGTFFSYAISYELSLGIVLLFWKFVLEKNLLATCF